MNILDTYLNLCTQVYDLSKPNPPEDAYAFYREYAVNAKGPILEPMCGTGRFLLPLLEEKFDIEGFDASDHMLEALYAKAQTKNLKPNVWKGFIENLKKSKQYNLIFIPSGSFCLIIDIEAVKSTLEAFYEHLSDEGVLLFEIETLQTVPQLNIWQGSVWRRPDDHLILISQFTTFENNVINSICKYELVHNNNVIHTEVEEYYLRIHETNELEKMLKECGFKNIRKIKAFDKNAQPDANDESIVYDCRKK